MSGWLCPCLARELELSANAGARLSSLLDELAGRHYPLM